MPAGRVRARAACRPAHHRRPALSSDPAAASRRRNLSGTTTSPAGGQAKEATIAQLGTCRPGDSCGLGAVTDNVDRHLHVRPRMSQLLLHGALVHPRSQLRRGGGEGRGAVPRLRRVTAGGGPTAASLHDLLDRLLGALWRATRRAVLGSEADDLSSARRGRLCRAAPRWRRAPRSAVGSDPLDDAIPACRARRRPRPGHPSASTDGRTAGVPPTHAGAPRRWPPYPAGRTAPGTSRTLHAQPSMPGPTRSGRPGRDITTLSGPGCAKPASTTQADK